MNETQTKTTSITKLLDANNLTINSILNLNFRGTYTFISATENLNIIAILLQFGKYELVEATIENGIFTLVFEIDVNEYIKFETEITGAKPNKRIRRKIR